MIPWYAVLILIALSSLVWIVLIVLRDRRQNIKIQNATTIVESMTSGDKEARLDSDHEGDLAKLFHEINSLADVLGAHADNRMKTNTFLKNTIEDISHQLKTPLAALNIYNGILQDDELSVEERNRFINLSEKELERMEVLIQNLLKLTKFDSGNVMFTYAEESAEEMILELYERFIVRAEHEKKKIVLHTEDVMCTCDRIWTMEALGNLVKNALDHTKEGGEIHLKCKKSGDDVCFIVEDNGSGIHEDDIFYIFSRFYRSRYSKDVAGIGLGLSLAKAIIENQRGLIEVESQLGKGSVFSVFLPNPTKL